mmetsp:Transcript_4700/g.10652  ORF Transcript_4700/g.10652 Transcript_4700/m.10652 type:complete len:87 (+) Transcript_4700:175-435(+)
MQSMNHHPNNAMSSSLDSPRQGSASSTAETPSSTSSSTMIDGTNQPMRNYDGTVMRDVSSRTVYKSQFLSTDALAATYASLLDLLR